jgi:hypothetical protein
VDIGPLVAAMDEIVRKAQAQLPHAERLTASRPVWERVLTGMREVEQLLRTGAAEVAPNWPDAAGERYAERLDRSATTVRGWQETLAETDAGQVVTALADQIRTTVEAILALRDEFAALAGQLATVAAGPGAAAAAQALVARLQAVAEQAAALLRELDAAFGDAARRLDGAADGTPWDGPAATMAASAGAGAGAGAGAEGAVAAAGVGALERGGAPGGGGGPGGGDGPGTGRGPGGVQPASLDEVAPGRAPELAGLTAPSPAGLPSAALPTVPSAALPTVPSAALPTVPTPVGVPPLGAAGSGRFGTAPFSRSGSSPGAPGSGGRISPIGTVGGIGSPGGAGPVGGPEIAKASRSVAATGPLAGAEPPPPPAAAGTGASTTASGGGVARGVPPLMAAPGADAGAGRPAGPGAAEARAGGHRDRPLGAVPGVPPALRGRSGPLTRAPGYLAEPGPGRAAADPEPLDDELWQVQQPPRPARGRAQD